jgi:predicted lipid-binding transport protein (Tim44 family)
MMQRASVSGMGNSAPPLSIGEADFNTFEQRLYEIQDAYSRGDEKALGDRTTPEMLSYFMQEIASNRGQGLRNELRQPKLLQGDLSESWREGTMEYATVAMRFSIIDAMVDATSGRVVSGSLDQPEEATEVWTFCRPANGRPQQWELSAIQQA